MKKYIFLLIILFSIIIPEKAEAQSKEETLRFIAYMLSESVGNRFQENTSSHPNSIINIDYYNNQLTVSNMPYKRKNALKYISTWRFNQLINISRWSAPVVTITFSKNSIEESLCNREWVYDEYDKLIIGDYKVNTTYYRSEFTIYYNNEEEAVKLEKALLHMKKLVGVNTSLF